MFKKLLVILALSVSLTGCVGLTSEENAVVGGAVGLGAGLLIGGALDRDSNYGYHHRRHYRSSRPYYQRSYRYNYRPSYRGHHHYHHRRFR